MILSYLLHNTFRKKLLLLAVFQGIIATAVFAQNATISGKILDESGYPISFANITIDSLKIGTVANIDGDYVLENIPLGYINLSVSAIGYLSINERILFESKDVLQKHFNLKEATQELDIVEIKGKTYAEEKREEAYAIELIQADKIQNRDVSVNQLASQVAGIRVRESGGLGSNFSYSLNGMSGRSVRFFIDGIPMDRYGSGYAINNFPINLINRVEIYKGVVPPDLGSDALGGAINLITKNSYKDYLDVSYSLGSFNTHRAAISTRWIHDSINLFIDVQGFYNYSDNDYKVWGPGVEVADPKTGRAVEIKTKRFHDSYRSASGKFDIGLQDKKWTDQIKFSFLYANNHNELQHGATMASVIGEGTRSETSYAPSLFYTKRNAFTQGLDLKLFSSISWLESNTVDTSSRTYDWEGKVVDIQPTNSEMGRGRNGKSLLSLKTRNQFHQANIAYSFGGIHKLNLNYSYDGTVRDGSDPLVSERSASFVEPQTLSKQISSLAYEVTLFNDKFTSTIWAKNYDFKAATVDVRYVTDSLGYHPKAFPIERSTNKFGYGAAFKYHLQKFGLMKLSLERSFRLPDAEEILGDGLFVRVGTELQPEESINLNVGWLVTDISLGEHHRISLEPTFFYRNTYNLIIYQVQQNVGTGQYINIGKVRGLGTSLDLKYRFKSLIDLNANVTYQDLRDGQKYDGPNLNQTYQDQLPNTPYLMANGGLSFSIEDVFWDKDKMSIYWDLQYVHEFFRNWPSLGDPNTKAVIPHQFTNSTGINYSFKSGRYNINLACQNIFNEQVYDNYLLQKPGRSFSIKLRTYLSKNN